MGGWVGRVGVAASASIFKMCNESSLRVILCKFRVYSGTGRGCLAASIFANFQVQYQLVIYVCFYVMYGSSILPLLGCIFCC